VHTHTYTFSGYIVVVSSVHLRTWFQSVVPALLSSNCTYPALQCIARITDAPYLLPISQAFLALSVDMALKWLYQPKADALPSPPALNRVTGDTRTQTQEHRH
jgi:hypothetical protein